MRATTESVPDVENIGVDAAALTCGISGLPPVLAVCAEIDESPEQRIVYSVSWGGLRCAVSLTHHEAAEFHYSESVFPRVARAKRCAVADCDPDTCDHADFWSLLRQLDEVSG